jgi:hypothetical protein
MSGMTLGYFGLLFVPTTGAGDAEQTFQVPTKGAPDSPNKTGRKNPSETVLGSQLA